MRQVGHIMNTAPHPFDPAQRFKIYNRTDSSILKGEGSWINIFIQALIHRDDSRAVFQAIYS
jgi:hypothetical protein